MVDVTAADVKMVRDALAGADFAAREWFETIVTQWEDAVEAAAVATEGLGNVRADLEKAQEERDEAKEEIEAIEAEIAERDETLLAVREWFERVLYLDLPMTDPRAMYRKVEEAMRHG